MRTAQLSGRVKAPYLKLSLSPHATGHSRSLSVGKPSSLNLNFARSRESVKSSKGTEVPAELSLLESFVSLITGSSGDAGPVVPGADCHLSVWPRTRNQGLTKVVGTIRFSEFCHEILPYHQDCFQGNPGFKLAFNRKPSSSAFRWVLACWNPRRAGCVTLTARVVRQRIDRDMVAEEEAAARDGRLTCSPRGQQHFRTRPGVRGELEAT